MGHYLGATELSVVLPAVGTITPSSTPLTIGEVASNIALIEAEINGAAAAAGYVVPISTSASDAWTLLRLKTIEGAGWRSLRTIYPNLGGRGNDASVAAEYRRAYQGFLDLLRNGDFPLVGAAISTGEEARELPRSWEVTSPRNATGARDPIITMGREF